MIYLPDTNTCIEFLRGRNIDVVRKFQSMLPDDIVLCDIVLAELWYGVYRSGAIAPNQQLLEQFAAPYRSVPFDENAAKIYGRIRREAEVNGKPIGPYDLQIASIALLHNLTLVTHNTREFSRVQGLKLEDWET